MSNMRVMLIAGESSGDRLAAELVRALRRQPGFAADGLGNEAPRFFGAGGEEMAAAGVELAFDMTQHAVVGLIEALKQYGKFRRLFFQLLDLAATRKPDLIICVDFSGFNRRFAAAVRRLERDQPELNWHPWIVQYVSPQVWASRPKRAGKMARDIDLLLSIFPFEKDWYARRVPRLQVEFIGHPIVERYQDMPTAEFSPAAPPTVLLLPGSRSGELRRHVPVMLEAAAQIRMVIPGIHTRMVLPTESLTKLARSLSLFAEVEFQCGGLAEALQNATIAIASTGTVTMECAWFGVPTVAIYKTSWSTYWIGRSIIQVPYLAMPNLLAKEPVFPEFIQNAATPEAIAAVGVELIQNQERRRMTRSKLAPVIASLGEPGASVRAAQAIAGLIRSGARPSQGANH